MIELMGASCASKQCRTAMPGLIHTDLDPFRHYVMEETILLKPFVLILTSRSESALYCYEACRTAAHAWQVNVARLALGLHGACNLGPLLLQQCKHFKSRRTACSGHTDLPGQSLDVTDERILRAEVRKQHMCGAGVTSDLHL